MSGQEQQRAMVIMAHPDDAEFGSAGTVAAWVRAGWHVTYVICTDASGGGSDVSNDVGLEARRQITAVRKAEQRAAADLLGVAEVIFLDYPDGRLQPTLELRRDLVRLLRLHRPSRVICPSPDRAWQPVLSIPRQHPDHLAVGAAALAAIYPAAQNPWDFPELLEEGLAPHRVREIYISGAPVINYAVDISELFEVKLAALSAHASQVGERFAEVAEMLRSRGAEVGASYGMALAEAYHRVEN